MLARFGGSLATGRVVDKGKNAKQMRGIYKHGCEASRAWGHGERVVHACSGRARRIFAVG